MRQSCPFLRLVFFLRWVFFPPLVLAVHLTRSPDHPIPLFPVPCNLFPHFPLTFGPLGQSICCRMKKILALLILVGFAPALAAELPFIQDNYPQALAQAKQRRQPLFVECWAPW